MTDWKSDERRTERWRGDEGRRDEQYGRGREDRSFGAGSRQDRLEGDDYGGMGVQGAEWRRTDSGGGFQGDERFGHSGGFDAGYGGQSGKAAWGPLSQGSSYGQGGPGWGHSGWEGGRHRSPRGRDDYGFRGQGGGGQQWGGERGSYGQGDFDRSAQRSYDRTTQYDPNDREGFIAYGRAYNDARDWPHDRQGHATDEDQGRDHDHEPAYRDWRERQLASHDADYRRWRSEQSRRYDSDYKSFRDQRHDTFSKGFQDWRDQQTADAVAGSPVTPATASGSTATAAAGAFDKVGDNVRNVADGGEGDAKREHKHDEHKHDDHKH
ncbi:MAG: hypothetical protein INR64_00275 [Caulobacteraceae bacterium]|nr:hypothetical protein [Caulobacter sp.]